MRASVLFGVAVVVGIGMGAVGFCCRAGGCCTSSIFVTYGGGHSVEMVLWPMNGTWNGIIAGDLVRGGELAHVGVRGEARRRRCSTISFELSKTKSFAPHLYSSHVSPTEPPFQRPDHPVRGKVTALLQRRLFEHVGHHFAGNISVPTSFISMLHVIPCKKTTEQRQSKHLLAVVCVLWPESNRLQ